MKDEELVWACNAHGGQPIRIQRKSESQSNHRESKKQMGGLGLHGELKDLVRKSELD